MAWKSVLYRLDNYLFGYVVGNEKDGNRRRQIGPDIWRIGKYDPASDLGSTSQRRSNG